MSENWTKGEWEVSAWVDRPNKEKPMISAEGVAVAITHPCPACPDVECEANAHLIAASPRMYDKLKDLLDVLPDGEWSYTKQEIREILSDARGES